MPPQNRRDEYIEPYYQRKINAVGTYPSREPAPDYLSPFLRSMMQPAHTPPPQPRTLPEYPMRSGMGNVLTQGDIPWMDRISRGISGAMAPAGPRPQPRYVPDMLGNTPLPDSQTQAPTPTPTSPFTRHYETPTRGGVPSRYGMPIKPMAAHASTIKPVPSHSAPSGFKGLPFSTIGSKFLSAFGGNGDVEGEDEDSITVDADGNPISDDPRDVRNSARMEAARRAGIPETEYAPQIPGKRTPRKQTPARLIPKTASQQMQFIPTNPNRFLQHPSNIANPGVNDANSLEAMQFLGPQEEEDNVGSVVEEPSNPAFERYMAHLNQFPEYQKPGILQRILAGATGAFEGGSKGAVAGFQAGRAAANAPYEEAVNRWATQGKGLGEAAELESGSAQNYMKMLNLQSQMDRRNAQTRLGERGMTVSEDKAANYAKNTEARMRMVLLREKEFADKGYIKATGDDGELQYINRRTGDVQHTGTTADAYRSYLLNRTNTGIRNAQQDRALNQAKERISQGWSREEMAKDQFGKRYPE